VSFHERAVRDPRVREAIEAVCAAALMATNRDARGVLLFVAWIRASRALRLALEDEPTGRLPVVME
jgi:hypothetical protein